MTNNKKMFSFIIILFIVLAGITGGLIYFAYNITNFTTYSKDTTIANISVTGLLGPEAKSEISKETILWKEKAKVNFVYQNYVVTINNEQFKFDVDKSFNEIKNGVNNTLYVSVVNKDFVSEVIANDIYFSKLNLDPKRVESLLLSNVNKLKYEINIDLGQETLLKESAETQNLYTVNIDEIERAAYIESLIKEIEIKSKGFSLIEFINTNFKELETDLKNEDYSVVASGIYRLILNSNFTSINKHISYIPPTHIDKFGLYGYEALINVEENRDLTFYNPNSGTYYIKISNPVPNRLTFTLVGQPFVNTISSSNANYVVIEPREIVRYNDTCPQVPFNQDGLKLCPGSKPGSRIFVTRTIFDYEGNLITTIISEDVYMPIDQVIIKKQSTTTINK